MYKVALNGTNNHQFLPMSVGHYTRPAYNISKSKLVFGYAPGVGQPYKLYISNADGLNSTQIIPSTGSSTGINEPFFSPDGSKLIFSRNSGSQFVFTNLTGTVSQEINAVGYENIQNIFWATNGTCYQTVYDTAFTTVTDTLLIQAILTGVQPPNNVSHLKIYPNPAKTHITIDYGNFALMNNYTCKITNSTGQIVFSTPINQQFSNINLSTWTGTGIYFVHLVDGLGNTIDIRKIVLQ